MKTYRVRYNLKSEFLKGTVWPSSILIRAKTSVDAEKHAREILLENKANYSGIKVEVLQDVIEPIGPQKIPILPGPVATIERILQAVASGPIRIHAGTILKRTMHTLIEGFDLHFRKIGDEIIFARYEEEIQEGISLPEARKEDPTLI